MKHIRFFLVLLPLLIIAACDNSDLWEKLPDPVQTFINKYFPNSELQSVAVSDKGCSVRIDNGPGMSFDAASQWTSVNGYGMPLPSVMLYDQLPEKLYNYLDETENLGSVFSMTRDKTAYEVKLMDTDIKYNIATGELSGTD